MKRQQRNLAAFGLLAVILGFTGKAFYRPHIAANNMEDYGIAGFLPSYFYVIGFSLLLLVRPNRYPLLLIALVALASVLFELYQWEQSGNFDLYDTLASIAGGFTAVWIVLGVKTGPTSPKP